MLLQEYISPEPCPSVLPRRVCPLCQKHVNGTEELTRSRLRHVVFLRESLLCLSAFPKCQEHAGKTELLTKTAKEKLPKACCVTPRST